MNRILPILLAAVLPLGVMAQTFSPTAAEGITGGSVGQSYSSDVSISDVPSSNTLSLSDLGLPSALDAVIALIPGGAPSSYTLTISSVEFTAEGLPAGLAGTVIVDGGSSGTLNISGTPTESGPFQVDIVSATTGQVDISPLLNALDGIPGAAAALALAGISNPYTLPQPIPGLYDEGTYDMFVIDPNGIEDLNGNEFGVTFLGENPFSNQTKMAVSVPVASTVHFEVIDINGRVARTFDLEAEQGINKFTLAPQVESGTYILSTRSGSHIKLTRFMVIK